MVDVDLLVGEIKNMENACRILNCNWILRIPQNHHRFQLWVAQMNPYIISNLLGSCFVSFTYFHLKLNVISFWIDSFWVVNPKTYLNMIFVQTRIVWKYQCGKYDKSRRGTLKCWDGNRGKQGRLKLVFDDLSAWRWIKSGRKQHFNAEPFIGRYRGCTLYAVTITARAYGLPSPGGRVWSITRNRSKNNKKQ